jgi:hypothetical protein
MQQKASESTTKPINDFLGIMAAMLLWYPRIPINHHRNFLLMRQTTAAEQCLA